MLDLALLEDVHFRHQIRYDNHIVGDLDLLSVHAQ
jgi:hypothetical protein